MNKLHPLSAFLLLFLSGCNGQFGGFIPGGTGRGGAGRIGYAGGMVPRSPSGFRGAMPGMTRGSGGVPGYTYGGMGTRGGAFFGYGGPMSPVSGVGFGRGMFAGGRMSSIPERRFSAGVGLGSSGGYMVGPSRGVAPDITGRYSETVSPTEGMGRGRRMSSVMGTGPRSGMVSDGGIGFRRPISQGRSYSGGVMTPMSPRRSPRTSVSVNHRGINTAPIIAGPTRSRSPSGSRVYIDRPGMSAGSGISFGSGAATAGSYSNRMSSGSGRERQGDVPCPPVTSRFCDDEAQWRECFTSDDVCTSQEKCCEDPCGFVCKNISYRRREPQCPTVTERICRGSPPGRPCSSPNSVCGTRQKCCEDPCGFVCKYPV